MFHSREPSRRDFVAAAAAALGAVSSTAQRSNDTADLVLPSPDRTLDFCESVANGLGLDFRVQVRPRHPTGIIVHIGMLHAVSGFGGLDHLTDEATIPLLHYILLSQRLEIATTTRISRLLPAQFRGAIYEAYPQGRIPPELFSADGQAMETRQYNARSFFAAFNECSAESKAHILADTMRAHRFHAAGAEGNRSDRLVQGIHSLLATLFRDTHTVLSNPTIAGFLAIEARMASALHSAPAELASLGVPLYGAELQGAERQREFNLVMSLTGGGEFLVGPGFLSAIHAARNDRFVEQAAKMMRGGLPSRPHVATIHLGQTGLHDLTCHVENWNSRNPEYRLALARTEVLVPRDPSALAANR